MRRVASSGWPSRPKAIFASAAALKSSVIQPVSVPPRSTALTVILFAATPVASELVKASIAPVVAA